MSSRSPRRALRAGTVASLLGLVMSIAAPAIADPSGQDVKREKQHAAQLEHQAQQQAAQARTAQQRLVAIGARANAALDQLVQARQALQVAVEEARTAAQRVAAATARADAARARLNDYAATAYMAGPGAGQLGTLISLVDSGDPQKLAGGLVLLGHVGDAQSDVLTELHVAEHAQRDAAAHADATASVAKGAADAARGAKERADQAVAAQARELQAIRAQLASTRSAIVVSKRRAGAMERELRLAQERARAGRVDVRAAKCLGGNLDAYPNGQLPIARLCRLYGVGSEVLRKDAATAFNAMSRAYERDFGVPICVADGYRTYAEQVKMKESRGFYAATPGRSNHGWGKAADLCAGVQTDGTATNNWMRANGPLFGWFHPSWAERGGGGPYEPWHWEYAG